MYYAHSNAGIIGSPLLLYLTLDCQHSSLPSFGGASLVNQRTSAASDYRMFEIAQFLWRTLACYSCAHTVKHMFNKYRIYHVYEEYIAFILRVGVVYPAYTTFDQSVEKVPRNAGLAFPEAAVIYDVMIHESMKVVY